MQAKEFYDKTAEKYDVRHDNDTIRYMQEFEKKFITKYAFGRTLDIGCGTARSLLWLKNAFGCDTSQEMLRKAKSKTKFPLIQCEAENLPYKDGNFDSVTCIFTVLNLCDYEKAVKEMSRLLKPGGVAIVSVASVWDRKNEKLLKRMLSNEKSTRINARIEKMRLKFHLFGKDDLVNLFENNGFSLKEFRGFYFLQKPYWGWYRSFTFKEKTKMLAENFLRFSVFNKAGRMYFAAFVKNN